MKNEVKKIKRDKMTEAIIASHFGCTNIIFADCIYLKAHTHMRLLCGIRFGFSKLLAKISAIHLVRKITLSPKLQ